MRGTTALVTKAKLQNVTECPGKGPDTTDQGRASGPESEQLPGWCCVYGPSPSDRKVISQRNASRLISCIKGVKAAEQPPGESESGEQSEPVFASAVGPARAASDRQRRGRRRAKRDGTPDDRAEFLCGSRAVAVARVYILHLQESNPPNSEKHSQRRLAGDSR